MERNIGRRNGRLLTENVVREKSEEKKTMEKEIMVNSSLTTVMPRK